jgi:hypothetical protein
MFSPAMAEYGYELPGALAIPETEKAQLCCECA